MTVGDRIRRLREDMSLNQRDCARASGMSQTMLSFIESGERDPGIGHIAALAGTLGCFMSTIEGHSEILDRLETAARTRNGNEHVDSTVVAERLGFFIELDAKMRKVGIGDSH